MTGEKRVVSQFEKAKTMKSDRHSTASTLRRGACCLNNSFVNRAVKGGETILIENGARRERKGGIGNRPKSNQIGVRMDIAKKLHKTIVKA